MQQLNESGRKQDIQVEVDMLGSKNAALTTRTEVKMEIREPQ